MHSSPRSAYIVLGVDESFCYTSCVHAVIPSKLSGAGACCLEEFGGCITPQKIARFLSKLAFLSDPGFLRNLAFLSDQAEYLFSTKKITKYSGLELLSLCCLLELPLWPVGDSAHVHTSECGGRLKHNLHKVTVTCQMLKYIFIFHSSYHTIRVLHGFVVTSRAQL